MKGNYSWDHPGEKLQGSSWQRQTLTGRRIQKGITRKFFILCQAIGSFGERFRCHKRCEGAAF